MTPSASADLTAAAVLAPFFASLSSRFSGDAVSSVPLGEDAVARVVDAARAGDAGARRTLYEQHVDRVYRVVRGMVHSETDAEDVTQDAMLTVLTSLHKYTPRAGARFGAWVMTIAVNTARRRFRRRRPELTVDGDLPDRADALPDPGDALDRARRRRALLLALADLPERDRFIVSLRYGAELNAHEIGSAVGLQPATVRKILERARAQLGDRLEVLLGPSGARA